MGHCMLHISQLSWICNGPWAHHSKLQSRFHPNQNLALQSVLRLDLVAIGLANASHVLSYTLRVAATALCANFVTYVMQERRRGVQKRSGQHSAAPGHLVVSMLCQMMLKPCTAWPSL